MYRRRRLTVAATAGAIVVLGAVAVRALEPPFAGRWPGTELQQGTPEPAAAGGCRVSSVVTPGARGEAVECVQRALNSTRSAPIPVDGDYGAQTQSAVREAQRAAGLLESGHVDQDTARVIGVWDGSAWPPMPSAAGPSNGGFVLPVPADGQVALTFDDGPSSPYTDQVLDILDHYEVRATFFVLGSAVSSGRATIERAHAAGHSIQNHSWTHTNFTRLTDRELRFEIDRTNTEIAGVTGHVPSCFRPPYGGSNERVRRLAAARGTPHEVLWTIDPLDWAGRGPVEIASSVLDEATGGGLIVLLHDGGDGRRHTVDALPAMIEGLIARGYEFVVLCR